MSERLADVVAATGCEYLLLTVNFITLRHDQCVRSMELLATEVLPSLAPAPAAAQ